MKAKKMTEPKRHYYSILYVATRAQESLKSALEDLDELRDATRGRRNETAWDAVHSAIEAALAEIEEVAP